MEALLLCNPGQGDAGEGSRGCSGLHHAAPSSICATTSSSAFQLACVTGERGYYNSAPETSKHFAFILDEEERVLMLCRDRAELQWIVPWLSEIVVLNYVIYDRSLFQCTEAF